MTLINRILEYTKSIPAEVKESKGIHQLTAIIAERKAFLSTQKLQYVAKFHIAEDQKQVRFCEMLKESGAGVSTGGDLDSSPGFGFKTETYKSGSSGREGSIEQQSSLFGKRYEYRFDYKIIRGKIEELAQEEGYQFLIKLSFKDL